VREHHPHLAARFDALGVDAASPLPGWLLSAFVNYLPYEVGGLGRARGLQAPRQGTANTWPAADLGALGQQRKATFWAAADLTPWRTTFSPTAPTPRLCSALNAPRPQQTGPSPARAPPSQAALRVLDISFLERSPAPLIRCGAAGAWAGPVLRAPARQLP
jgi:hypothetical protein